MSMLKICSKVSRATLRIARCPIFAKVAFKSSPNTLAPILAAPSEGDVQNTKVNVFVVDVHPSISVPATVQTVEPDVISTLRESTTSLKISGTCTFNN
jgi:hypothetical protein